MLPRMNVMLPGSSYKYYNALLCLDNDNKRIIPDYIPSFCVGRVENVRYLLNNNLRQH